MATYLAFHEVTTLSTGSSPGSGKSFSDRMALRPAPSGTRTDQPGRADHRDTRLRRLRAAHADRRGRGSDEARWRTSRYAADSGRGVGPAARPRAGFGQRPRRTAIQVNRAVRAPSGPGAGEAAGTKSLPRTRLAEENSAMALSNYRVGAVVAVSDMKGTGGSAAQRGNRILITSSRGPGAVPTR